MFFSNTLAVSSGSETTKTDGRGKELLSELANRPLKNSSVRVCSVRVWQVGRATLFDATVVFGSVFDSLHSTKLNKAEQLVRQTNFTEVGRQTVTIIVCL